MAVNLPPNLGQRIQLLLVAPMHGSVALGVFPEVTYFCALLLA